MGETTIDALTKLIDAREQHAPGDRLTPRMFARRLLDELGAADEPVQVSGTDTLEAQELSRLRSEIRGHEHHERKATEALDAAGVEKYDPTDADRQGREWSLYRRIEILAAERDAALASSPSQDREAVVFKQSERGFKHYAPIETVSGHVVKVYESSAAHRPCLWLGVDGSAAHLTLEEVDSTIAALIAARDNHYQRTS